MNICTITKSNFCCLSSFSPFFFFFPNSTSSQYCSVILSFSNHFILENLIVQASQANSTKQLKETPNHCDCYKCHGILSCFSCFEYEYDLVMAFHVSCLLTSSTLLLSAELPQGHFCTACNWDLVCGCGSPQQCWASYFPLVGFSFVH